jgi:hypothetical protein
MKPIHFMNTKFLEYQSYKDIEFHHLKIIVKVIHAQCLFDFTHGVRFWMSRNPMTNHGQRILNNFILCCLHLTKKSLKILIFHTNIKNQEQTNCDKHEHSTMDGLHDENIGDEEDHIFYEPIEIHDNTNIEQTFTTSSFLRLEAKYSHPTQ